MDNPGSVTEELSLPSQLLLTELGMSYLDLCLLAQVRQETLLETIDWLSLRYGPMLDYFQPVTVVPTSENTAF